MFSASFTFVIIISQYARCQPFWVFLFFPDRYFFPWHTHTNSSSIYNSNMLNTAECFQNVNVDCQPNAPHTRARVKYSMTKQTCNLIPPNSPTHPFNSIWCVGKWFEPHLQTVHIIWQQRIERPEQKHTFFYVVYHSRQHWQGLKITTTTNDDEIKIVIE